MDTLRPVVDALLSLPRLKVGDMPNNFRIISGSFSGKIAFVDGGSNEIFKAPHFSLQFVRVHGCVYQQEKRIRSVTKEFFLLVSANSSEKLKYQTHAIPVNFSVPSMSFDPYDPALQSGGKKMEISKVVDIVRTVAELVVSKELVESLSSGDILVRDGDLAFTHEKTYYNELIQLAEQRNVCISAVAKTCDVLKESYSFVAHLNEAGPTFSWMLDHDGDYYAKLDERARYIFKVQSVNPHAQLFAALRDNASDPVFPGYPYGLLEADRRARVSHQEVEMLRVRLETMMGKDLASIHHSLRAMDAHAVLDNIS